MGRFQVLSHIYPTFSKVLFKGKRSTIKVLVTTLKAERKNIEKNEVGNVKHALLVDDEPLFQAIIREAFDELGPNWRLSVFGTGREALQFLSESSESIELALVDLGLPDMNGTEVIKKVRIHHPDAPVLVISIFSDQTHVIEAIRAGARGYLLKDDSALAIADSIRRVDGGEYPISPSLARHLFTLAVREKADPVRGNSISLPPKELELLQLLAKGHSYKRAALMMDVSLSTIQTYVQRMYQKLESNSKVEAITKARSQGLIE